MSDLKRCREAFEKIYPEDSGDRFDRVLYDKWLMFKAGWYASRRAEDDWQPIETAPKDGTRFQIRNTFISIAKYTDQRYLQHLIDGIGSMKQIQEWKPLPAPPQPPSSMNADATDGQEAGK
jgi:hypothetical protein